MKHRLIRTTFACTGILAASAGVTAAATTEPPASSETAGSSEPCVVETIEPSETTEPTEHHCCGGTGDRPGRRWQLCAGSRPGKLR